MRFSTIKSNNVPIFNWCINPEFGSISQARNVASLLFAKHHVALLPDTHQGYGMPIGCVLATGNEIIPNALKLTLPSAP